MERQAQSQPNFSVTQRAIDQLTAQGQAVHLQLSSGGCSGATFTFELLPCASRAPVSHDEGPGPSAWFGCDGAWLVVDADAAMVLDGATLDYSPSIRPPRFRVLKAPKVHKKCPCRRSFGMEWPGPGSQECISYQPMSWDESFEPPARFIRQTGWTRDKG